MPATTFPEDIVTAILYKVGRSVRIEQDQHFTDIFDEFAQSKGGEFLQFRAHPQYRYSSTLESVMQTLAVGGSIVRIGLSMRFIASPHTCGPYGKSVFQDLDKGTREAVCELAERIQAAYPLASRK